MAVLLVLVAILTVHVTEADYECRSAAAGTGGDCVRVDIGDTHCSLLNFNEMKTRCCPGNSGQPECNRITPYWHSGEDSPTTGPNKLTLTASPVDCLRFNLTISWPRIDEAIGYKVVIRKGTTSGSQNIIGNYSTNQTTTHLTLPEVCYNPDYSILYIELWKIIEGGQELVVNSTTIGRGTCYTLFEGNSDSHCGPKVAHILNKKDIEIKSQIVSEELFDATISWPSSNSAYQYDLTLQNITAKQNIFFKVSNTSMVVLTGLNSFSKYKVQIQPLVECAGMYTEKEDYTKCPIAESIAVPLPSSIIPSPTSSFSLLITSTSLPLTSSPVYVVGSTSPSSSSNFNRAHLIIVITLLVGLLFVIIPLLAFGLVKGYRFRVISNPPPSPNPSQRPMIISGQSPLPSPLIYPTNYNGDSSSPTLSQSAGYIYQFPACQQRVWVLYSLDTPECEKFAINELLHARLLSYEIVAETPCTIPQRNILREWMERGVNEASAVFFVCNDQFYSEWLSESPSHVGGAKGGVKIGRDARMLKNGISNEDLAKFAFVHFKSSDEEFFTSYPEILTPFIAHYYSLVGNKHAIVHSIASFVRNIPRYAV